LQAKHPLEFELTISNEHFTLHKATRLALNPSKKTDNVDKHHKSKSKTKFNNKKGI